MTDEQKELDRRFDCGIGVLESWRSVMLETKGESDLTKMMKVVIDDYRTMYKEWRFAIGHPKEVSVDTLDEILEETMKILRYRIKDKTF